MTMPYLLVLSMYAEAKIIIAAKVAGNFAST